MRICRSTMLPAITLLLSSVTPAEGQLKDYPIRPVSFTAVRLTDAFWAPRLEINRTVTIPYEFKKCEESGRIQNFAIAGRFREGEQCGVYPFDDSDPYKIIEGAAYSLAAHPDPVLDRYLDRLIDTIGAAQEADGYLYTARTNNAKRLVNWAGPSRWMKEQSSHELYDAGHLYEAAVAHYQATGKRSLLAIALKNADLVASVFGPGKLRLPPGHEEIEIGLSKLYRVTGDAKYLNLARFFLDERGHADNGRSLWGEYAQDQKPILEQEELVGHAVRALYMCSGIADVVALSGDRGYVVALDRLWRDLVGKKFYITGGVGSENFGESIGAAYDLPNMSAYCETCASVANVLFNERMFLLHGDGAYIDVLERTLYNALLAGVSMNGDRFFYPNPLASRGQHERSPWFECACCPTNIARFIPSVPGYVYACTDDSLFVNLYIQGEANVRVGPRTVSVSQETRYPWEGDITLTVTPDQPFMGTVLVRIPGWARNEALPENLYCFADSSTAMVGLTVNGRPVSAASDRGYAAIRRVWKRGDVIRLTLPMAVRRIRARAEIGADAGRVALQRGPLVYCAEWPDNAGGHVLDLFLSDDADLRSDFRPSLLKGITVVSGKAYGTEMTRSNDLVKQEQPVTTIPYYAWAHRGAGEMTVWIADDISKTLPLNSLSIGQTSRVSSSGGINLEGITSRGRLPADTTQPGACFQWRPRADTTWVQYDFEGIHEVSEVDVSWFDDGAGCLVPRGWRILARVNGNWEPVWTPDRKWGTDKLGVNRVIFETVRTDALRLEAWPQKDCTSGIRDWRVY